jgi:hypothetical protein
MPTVQQARQRSDWLTRHGKALLDAFDLMPALAKFGEVYPLGSFSYDLMQVTDLDFKIFCPKLDRSAIWELASAMSARPDVVGIRHLDFTKQPDSPAKGVYLNVYPHFADELWKIDLLFLPASAKPAKEDDFFVRLRGISPQQRDTILSIKAELLEAGRYSNPAVFHSSHMVHGMEVYRAVLEEGAQTTDDVLVYKNKLNGSGDLIQTLLKN